jgi:hypothetical protein
MELKRMRFVSKFSIYREMYRTPAHPHLVSHPCVSNTRPILRLREIYQLCIFENQVSRHIKVPFFPTVTTSGTCWRRRLGQTEAALLEFARGEMNTFFI